MSYAWTGRRIAVGAWCALLAAALVATAYPVATRGLRLFVLLAGLALWFGAAALTWRRTGVSAPILVAGLLGAAGLCLPGRPPDPAALREAYVTCLQRYEGARYVWGGENKRGLDCSGLVRAAMVDAERRTGLRTLNPRLLRTALALWWNDCSAKALREEYLGLTVCRFAAQSLNGLDHTTISPGDLAVTANGVHVLAYVGGQTWIEADPAVGRVIEVTAPSDNMWFDTPVDIVRWRRLQE